MRVNNFREPWWMRRAVYLALALALTIAVGGGWITDAQADSWLSGADKVISVLAALGLGVAASKTHRGSDDPTTHEDVTTTALASTAGVESGLHDVVRSFQELQNQLSRVTQPLAGAEVPPVVPSPGDYRTLLSS